MQEPQDFPRWAQVLIAIGIPSTMFVWARWSGRAYVREVVRDETKEMHTILTEVRDNVQYIRGRFDQMDRQ